VIRNQEKVTKKFVTRKTVGISDSKVEIRTVGTVYSGTIEDKEDRDVPE
jgi:hypothetical protein